MAVIKQKLYFCLDLKGVGWVRTSAKFLLLAGKIRPPFFVLLTIDYCHEERQCREIQNVTVVTKKEVMGISIHFGECTESVRIGQPRETMKRTIDCQLTNLRVPEKA